MSLLASLSLLLLASATTRIESRPDLGTAEGRCRPDEQGPAIIVDVEGLKDRTGRLRLELYPPDDDAFLADDNILISEGKTFRRVDMAVAQDGPVRMCIRAPAPGSYTLSLLHDRDANRKFGLSTDGIGFPGNPKLGWSKPKAAAARIMVGAGRTETRIVPNYRQGLLSFGPVRKRDR